MAAFSVHAVFGCAGFLQAEQTIVEHLGQTMSPLGSLAGPRNAEHVALVQYTRSDDGVPNSRALSHTRRKREGAMKGPTLAKSKFR